MTPRVSRLAALPPGFPLLRDAALAEGWKMLRVLEEDMARQHRLGWEHTF